MVKILVLVSKKRKISYLFLQHPKKKFFTFLVFEFLFFSSLLFLSCIFFLASTMLSMIITSNFGMPKYILARLLFIVLENYQKYV